jgi:hypothetical protein
VSEAFGRDTPRSATNPRRQHTARHSTHLTGSNSLKRARISICENNNPFRISLSNIRATQPLPAADPRAPGKQRRLDDEGVRKWKRSNIITHLGPQSLQQPASWRLDGTALSIRGICHARTHTAGFGHA